MIKITIRIIMIVTRWLGQYLLGVGVHPPKPIRNHPIRNWTLKSLTSSGYPRASNSTIVVELIKIRDN